MAYRENKIGLMVRLEPTRAARRIAAAWSKAGTETGTALALGCGRRSLQRWVRALEAAGLTVRPVEGVASARE